MSPHCSPASRLQRQLPKWGDDLSRTTHSLIELNYSQTTFALCSSSVSLPPSLNWEKASTDLNTVLSRAHWDVRNKWKPVALNFFFGTTPGHWFKYVDDTWVKVKKKSRSGFVYCPHQCSGSYQQAYLWSCHGRFGLSGPQYTLQLKEASTLKCTQRAHTQTSIFF